MIRIFGTVFAGLVGLACGSFLNVCLTRWPAGESIATPRSHCRSCGRTLAWWENIPILSWIVLRGRCRTCGVWIGWRYPFVELAVGAAWTIAAWRIMASFANVVAPLDVPIVSYSPLFLLQTAETLGGTMLLTWLLVGLAALDAEHLWLPDIVTLPGLVVGIVVTLLRGDSFVALSYPPRSVLDQLLRIAFAIVIAAGLIFLIRWLYWLIRRREGIGLGDAKLMAMLAAWLGLPGALLAFAVGVVLGAVVGLAVLAQPKDSSAEKASGLTKLPLGTFLCIGGIFSTLWGQPILAAYLRWAGFN